MQKYFKIATVCKGNDIYNCFTSSYTSNGLFGTDAKSITLTGKKNPADINNTYASKYSDFVGLKFADGVSMIIAVKPNCEGPAEGDSAGRSNVSELAKCFVYYYDVNGEQSPNAKGKDIIANIGAAGEDAISIGKPAPMTYEECEAFSAEHPDLNGGGCDSYGDPDYWIGAVAACYDQGLRLSNQSDLATLAVKLYNDSSCSSDSCNPDKSKINKDLWQELSGSAYSDGSRFFLWSSSVPDNITANIRAFSTDISIYSSGSGRAGSSIRAVCIR